MIPEAYQAGFFDEKISASVGGKSAKCGYLKFMWDDVSDRADDPKLAAVRVTKNLPANFFDEHGMSSIA